MKKKFLTLALTMLAALCLVMCLAACGHTHNMAKVDAKQATCDEVGNTEYWYCSKCDKYFGDEKGKTEIAKDSWIVNAGHTFDEIHWEIDGEYHWHKATCEHVDLVKDKAMHTPNALDVCTGCGREVAQSIGLAFKLNADGESYSVSGIGTSTSKNLKIPATYDNKPVTGIASSAFINNDIVSISIPGSVTEISQYAFAFCDNVTKVTFSDGLTVIGEYAFWGCSGIKNVTLPNTLTTIATFAFSECTSLTDISIPDSVMSIGQGVFNGCDSLKFNEFDNLLYLGNATNKYMMLIKPKTEQSSFTLNDDTMHICDGAFSGMDSLTSVLFGSNSKLKSIGMSAFSLCGLTSVTLPDSVITVSNEAFLGCDRMEELLFGTKGNLTTIGAKAFLGCSALTNVTVPDGVTSIGEVAFGYCDSLTSITLPDSLIDLGNSIFYACESLASVNLPDGLTALSDGLFSGCSNLVGIVIPDSVTSIERDAFNGCTNLESVTFGSNNQLKSIGYEAFYNCTSLTRITIPNSVTIIGNYAFEGCDSLTCIFYEGTADDWQQITVGEHNTTLSSATVYYFSQTEPTDQQWAETENWWHYDAQNIPVVWTKQGQAD